MDQHQDPGDAFEGESVLRSYIDRCTNWGRWGPDDELGTLNYVGEEEVRHAATLVRQGKVISMALPFDLQGPQSGPFRSNPRNVMTATGADHVAGVQRPPEAWGPPHGFGYADDVLVVPNQAGTQWDALGHIFWEGKMWNGRSAAEVGAAGARFGGIQAWRNTLVMRGVLLDVARMKGQEALEPGYGISVDDLEETASHQDVDVHRGDALIIRTGMLEQRRGEWGDYAGGPAPGLSVHTTPWLHERQVAAIAADTWGAEVRPNELAVPHPLHIIGIVHLGLAIGEIFDLGEIGADCARDGVYEFLFVAPALPVTGAAGCPVNPLAVK